MMASVCASQATWERSVLKRAQSVRSGLIANDHVTVVSTVTLNVTMSREIATVTLVLQEIAVRTSVRWVVGVWTAWTHVVVKTVVAVMVGRGNVPAPRGGPGTSVNNAVLRAHSAKVAFLPVNVLKEKYAHRIMDVQSPAAPRVRRYRW